MSEIEQLDFTPAALVQTVNEELARACGDAFGPKLRAVILTGSMARNEATFTHQNGQTIFLSDVEAIVVLHNAARLLSRQGNAALCKNIEQVLVSRGVHVHVSLSIVHASYLRELPPDIYSYELRACGQVVFGEKAILKEIPAYSASGLTMEDAWRLLSNRLIEQMEDADQELLSGKSHYRSIKLCLDLAASMLVFVGQFQAGYGPRLQRIQESSSSFESADLPFSIDEFLPIVRHCTRGKLRPGSADSIGEDLSKQITSWAWEVWLWQLQRMTSLKQGTAASEMIRTLGRSQGLGKLVRGWLYAARRSGLLSSASHFPKWLTLLAQGQTPRYAIYLAAYEWTHRRSDCETPKIVGIINNLLPVAEVSKNDTEVTRQICWNYNEFVTETRA